MVLGDIPERTSKYSFYTTAVRYSSDADFSTAFWPGLIDGRSEAFELVCRTAAFHPRPHTTVDIAMSTPGSSRNLSRVNFTNVHASRADSPAPELPGLTPLRGIAALGVLLFHSSLYAYHFAGGSPPWLWRRGYLAVDLFFFLSGFVLTHVYGHRLAEQESWRTTRRFLWARFCRIYPTSLFTTAVFVLAYTVGSLHFPADASFTSQVVAALLLLQVPWLNDIVINSPSWSISAELYAYLLFPFVVPMICRLSGGTATIFGISLLLAVAADHTIFSHEQQNFGWGALIRALPEFLVGAFAYRFYSEGIFRRFWEKDATLVGVSMIIVAACLADVSDGVIVVLLLALLLASVWNSGKITDFLNARTLRLLGEASYSIYIFQILPFMVAVSLSGMLVAHGFGGSRFQVIATLFAIGGGLLVHRRVDTPIRAALRRLPDRLLVFAPASRAAETGTIPPTSAAMPEQDG
jgi:peptidoglycan/LPS O-acetylase OafA/YrhL